MSISFHPCVPPDEKCAICWDDYRENKDAVSHTVGDVDHVFHRSCLENWSRERPICPLCTRHIEMPQIPGPLNQTSFLRRATSVIVSSAGCVAAAAALVVLGAPTVTAVAVAGGAALCGRVIAQVEGPVSTAFVTVVGSAVTFGILSREPIGMVVPQGELIQCMGSVIIGLLGSALGVAVENNWHGFI